jgi:maltose-binding protein MalE
MNLFSKRNAPFALALVSLLILTACQGGGTFGPTPAVPIAASATRPAIPTTPVAPDVPTPTIDPSPSRITLRLWTSPEAAPDEDTPGGEVLARQLAAFEAENSTVGVEVRVKKTAGVGGLLDFLRTASAAAPAALPDVIALSRDDLATAAREGLVQPLAGVLPPDSLSDYYSMPQEAALVDGALYAVPFSAEATVLVYNTELRATPPITWTDVLSPTSAFLLPLGDPLGLVTLQQYYAIGGAVSDDSGDLALDSGLLAEVLGFYQSASEAGVFPANSDEFTDPAGTWLAYREHRATLAAAPAALYLRERERTGATSARLLPTRDGTPLALGTSWSYALVTTDPVRQPLAFSLMLWLTSPSNLGAWTQAAGVLPPRASALDSWTDEPAARFARQVMSAAVLQPNAAALTVLGPPLKQAVTDALDGRLAPQAAAERAAAAVAAQ